MKTRFLFILMLVCITQKQVNDRICKALCLKSYDGGYSVKNECYCIENKGLIDDFARGQIKVYANTFQDSKNPAPEDKQTKSTWGIPDPELNPTVEFKY